jgi:predicted nuclease with TOPRIM domain
MNAMREQQLAIQKNVDINTDTMASLCMQMDKQQQDMDFALRSLRKEQTALQSRQEALKEYVNNISIDGADIANQVQSLSQEIVDLSIRFDNKQKLLAANYDSLANTQSSFREAMNDVQENHKTLHADLASLQAEQVSIAEVASNDHEEIGALTLACQTATQSVNDLKELTHSHHEELQGLSTQVAQKDAAWNATLVPVQENVQHLEADVQTLRIHQTQAEQAAIKQSDELLRKISELQASYSQWQDRLASLQQEISLLRDSATTLDSEVARLQEGTAEQE